MDQRWNEEEPRRCRRRRTSEETTGCGSQGGGLAKDARGKGVRGFVRNKGENFNWIIKILEFIKF